MTGGNNGWRLSGTPSDEAAAILATGATDIDTLFISLSEKHPEGRDAQYLHWHSLDHRPEQYRLAALQASLRAVSNPACRRARAASDPRFDAADHIMAYFFSGEAGLQGFGDLSTALRDAGRSPFILPPVARGVFSVQRRIAAPRAMAGADVLPWRPTTGVYLLLEQGAATPANLTEVPGIAGVWGALSSQSGYGGLEAGLQLSYCFLDGDPVATAELLKPVLEARWQTTGLTPLLAAPFYTLVPFQWDRYLP